MSSSEPPLNTSKSEYLQYGGQAIIEGVMMRSPKFFSVACRAPNKQIVLRTEAIEKTWIGRQKWLKLPFLRGGLAILDSMALGLRAMKFASNVQLEEDLQDPDEVKKLEAEQAAKGKAATKAPSQRMQDGLILGTIILSLAIGLFIFQYLPNLISAAMAGDRSYSASYTLPDGFNSDRAKTELKKAGFEDVEITASGSRLDLKTRPPKKLAADKVDDKIAEVAALPAADAKDVKQTGAPDWRINLITEIIKILMFIGYIWAISRMKEIQRVFQYHGAEHKAINTLEAGQELTMENCRKQTRLHPRCGTSFAVIVLLISLVFFTFIPRPDLKPILASVVRFLIEIPLLLILAGIAYELIRIAGKFRNQAWVGYLFWPGLMTQYITTSEPDDEQIEVALESLKATIAAENSGSAPDETQYLGEPKLATV